MTTPEPAALRSADERRPPVWVAFLALWTLLGLVESASAIVRTSLMNRPIGWGQALVNNMPWWLLWAVLTPIPVALSRRFPMQGPRWTRAAGVHAAAALGVSAAHLLLEGAVYYFTPSAPVAPSLRWQWIGFFTNYLLLDLITYGVIVAACHAMQFYGRFRETELQKTRLELGLAEARLQALRSELNPHFLFNTLNSIAGLVRRGDDVAAVGMLARLGDLLSATLDHHRPPRIPLREELDLLDRYLDIERVRFGDRLTIAVSLQPRAAGALVPTFLLQPLVENAIRHGVAKRAGSARVEVDARLDKGMLELEVRDTGPGIPAEAREGIGLSNTRERLATLYRGEASLLLETMKAGGARARISLPYQAADGLVAHAG